MFNAKRDSHLHDDSESVHAAAFIGAGLDAATEYLTLRQTYARLVREGDHDRAADLAGAAPRLLHRLAREGLLAGPRTA
jgi:hypothetical protein